MLHIYKFSLLMCMVQLHDPTWLMVRKSSFVVVVMALIITDAECYQLVNGEWQQMNNGLSTADMQHASSPTSSHQIWMTGVLVVMVKDCHQAPT